MKNIYDLLNQVELDFEEYEECELSEMEREQMKQTAKKVTRKRPGMKRYLAIAASVAVVAAMSQTALAQNMISNILSVLTTGHNRFVQSDMQNMPVPEYFLGRVYDKDGNPVTIYPADGILYDPNGKEIVLGEGDYQLPDNVKGLIAMEKVDGEAREANNHIYTDVNEVLPKLNFTVKLPSYLPEGYSLSRARQYGDSGDYLDLYYTNEQGMELFIQERRISEETAFEAGVESMERVTVNGHDAVFYDGHNLDWEADGVSVALMAGKTNLSRDELFRMAESMK